jgi:hypothetical protein
VTRLDVFLVTFLRLGALSVTFWRLEALLHTHNLLFCRPHVIHTKHTPLTDKITVLTSCENWQQEDTSRQHDAGVNARN